MVTTPDRFPSPPHLIRKEMVGYARLQFSLEPSIVSTLSWSLIRNSCIGSVAFNVWCFLFNYFSQLSMTPNVKSFVMCIEAVFGFLGNQTSATEGGQAILLIRS